MHPQIGDVVIYRSRTGEYDVPAIITCTTETLNEKGLEAGNIPALASDTHVHLTVFSPGFPGSRRSAEDFKVKSDYPISENFSGCYQEWDIPFDEIRDAHVPPGTWRYG